MGKERWGPRWWDQVLIERGWAWEEGRGRPEALP